MPFYEISYETGRVSVAQYDSDEEALSACGEQHRRAVEGQPGGPLGVPAERVKKIRVYKKHPNEYNPEQTMSGDVLAKEVAELVKSMSDANGVVDVSLFAVEVRNITHPMVDNTDRESFDSIFKMKEDKELKLTFAGGN